MRLGRYYERCDSNGLGPVCCRSDEALRRRHGGERPVVRRPGGQRHRLPGAERRRQDHHDASAARARGADAWPRPGLRSPVRRARPAGEPGRSRARGCGPPSGAHGARPSPSARAARGRVPGSHRGGASARRPAHRRRPLHEGLLARHAPASEPRGSAARRSRAARPRRAGQRARPRGRALAPRPPARVCSRRPNGLRLEPPACGGRTDGSTMS
jgi:hypothetical protein